MTKINYSYKILDSYRGVVVMIPIAIGTVM